MATRGKVAEMKVVSPVLISVCSMKEAAEIANRLETISKEVGGFMYSKLSMLEEGVWKIEFSFTTTEQYAEYRRKASQNGLF